MLVRDRLVPELSVDDKSRSEPAQSRSSETIQNHEPIELKDFNFTPLDKAAGEESDSTNKNLSVGAEICQKVGRKHRALEVIVATRYSQYLRPNQEQLSFEGAVAVVGVVFGMKLRQVASDFINHHRRHREHLQD